MPNFQEQADQALAEAQARRQEAYLRLDSLAHTRQAWTDEMYRRAEQQRMADEADLAQSKTDAAAKAHADKINWLDDASEGAAKGGSVGGPWGALVGGIIGTVKGQAEAIGQRSRDGDGYFKAVGKTLFDTPIKIKGYGGGLAPDQNTYAVGGMLGKKWHDSATKPEAKVESYTGPTAPSSGLVDPNGQEVAATNLDIPALDMQQLRSQGANAGLGDVYATARRTYRPKLDY